MGIYKEGKYLIKIISSVINNIKLHQLEDEIDYNMLFKLAKFHSVESLLYRGIIKNEISIPSDILKQLEKINTINIYKEATQDVEKTAIATALEKNNIKHMFLKGVIIKKMYPVNYLRSMADIDILVEKGMLKKVKAVMKSLNYKVNKIGGNHDVYYKRPFMNIEMHRNMIDEKYEFAKYYQNIWSKLIKSDNKNYEYYLTDEDYYIYLVAHLAKHFANGGTGIRSIIDIYIYLEHKRELNWKYINEEFSKLQLSQFSENIKRLAYYWFGDGEVREDLDLISEFIIGSGTYGITTNSMIVNGFMGEESDSLSSGKLRYIFKKTFLPYKDMKIIFPVLKYLPFLLPIYWAIRLMKILFKRTKTVKSVYKDLKNIDKNKVEKVKEVHNKVGIKKD